MVDLSNIPWILDNGMHCRNSAEQDPNFVNIGSPELIQKRASRKVPISPYGTLSDYVQFYFTPFPIMMFNIHTGFRNIARRENKEIVMFVSSIHRLRELELRFAFTNQHAYAVDTEFYARVEDLDRIDWGLLQSRDFKTDDVDPGKQLRYQAEALVHRHVPLEALVGIGCHNADVRIQLELELERRQTKMSVKTTPNWYF